MARNKAVFDADILINMVKTKSLDYLTQVFENIFISDYVWEEEIKEGTLEYKVLKKMINKSFIVVLKYNELTENQKSIYRYNYEILKKQVSCDFVNEGERRTAAFAKAHCVPYYMSDDNRAAPYIKSISDVEVINYGDLLYIAYNVKKEDTFKLNAFYSEYLSVFKDSKLPRAVKDRNGNVLKFSGIMAKSHDKFNRSENLSSLLKLLMDKYN